MKKFGLSFVVFTVLLFVVSSMSCAEEMEGTLEVIMATKISETQKSCKPLYFINTGGKKMQFSMPATAPPMSPGQKIKISGGWDESDGGKKNFHCRKVTTIAATKFAVKNAEDSTDSNHLPEQMPVLGAQRTLVLLLHFPKHETPEWGKEKAENKVFASKPSGWPHYYTNDHSDNAYWKECSGGKMWLEGECLDGWKTMPKPATEYGYGGNSESDFFGDLITDALDTVDAEVDFTQYDRIICIRTGKGWGYSFSGVGKGNFATSDGIVEISICFVTELDAELDRDYTTHEFGHGLGLIHANSKVVSTGEIYTYGDEHDNRGQTFAQLDELHRWILGWLDISQIKIVASSGDYWLDQRELSSDGIKLLVIFLGYDDNGNPLLYYLEYFKELGEFDSRVFYDFDFEFDAKREVVLLRKYQNEADYDSLVYTDGESWPNDDVPVLGLLEEFCDSDYENIGHYGVCVQVLQKIGTGANSQAEVSITISTPTPTPITKPEPSPTPSPSPSPTLEPTPSPSPTPALDKMSLEVSLNKEVVRRGGKVKVSVEVKDVGGSLVEANKISCEMKRPNGTWLYGLERNTPKAKFNFRIRKKNPVGQYKISVSASKEGYENAVSKLFFKVKK